MKEKERRWVKYDYKRCKYLTYKLQIITYIFECRQIYFNNYVKPQLSHRD